MNNSIKAWWSSCESSRPIGMIALCFFAMALLGGCQPERANNSSKSKTGPSNAIATTTYPYQFITQQLLGTGIEVHFPAAAAENPRVWRPTPTDIEEIQAADLVVTGGPALPYAEWISKVSLSESRIVNCSNALKLSDYVHIEDYRVVHRHGPGGEHSHPLLIPYSWLDPSMAKKQAVFIAKRLNSSYPDRAETIDANLAELSRSLDGLANEIKRLDLAGHKLIFTSPNLSFVARVLGVENDYLLWVEPAKDKTEEEVRQQEIKSRFAADDSLVILAAGSFAEQTIEAAFPGSGPRVVPIGLLDLAPENGDYVSAMKEMIANLKQTLSESPTKQ